MPRAPKPNKGSITRLLPNAIIIQVNGEEITVPLDRQENCVADMIMAAQGRNLIQRALNHYKDNDEIPTPKQLSEVTQAMKNLASFSAEVYAAAEPIASSPKQVEQAKDDDVSFDDLTKITEIDGNTDKTPEAGDGKSSAVPPGETAP